ncbi:MAG: NUDIX domain-containing protein [Candidatus Micrarchaeota archaeon]
MKILVFGNPLMQKDSIGLRILPELNKRFPAIEFAEFDAAEDLEKEGKELFILDAVLGLKKCEIITDLERFESASRNLSMHDFDLYQTLLLLNKIGAVRKATIIGIPCQYPKQKALKEAAALIEQLLENEKEYLYWVDPKDRVLGKIERKEAHAKKLLHRTGAVLVFDSKNRLLVTKRSPKKKIFPNKLDCSSSFHVRFGETYEKAAQRELFEETGIKAKPEMVGKFVLDQDPDHLVAAVFKTVHDGKIRLDPSESISAKFFTEKKVNELVRTKKTTTWLVRAWKLYKETKK